MPDRLHTDVILNIAFPASDRSSETRTMSYGSWCLPRTIRCTSCTGRFCESKDSLISSIESSLGTRRMTTRSWRSSGRVKVWKEICFSFRYLVKDLWSLDAATWTLIPWLVERAERYRTWCSLHHPDTAVHLDFSCMNSGGGEGSFRAEAWGWAGARPLDGFRDSGVVFGALDEGADLLSLRRRLLPVTRVNSASSVDESCVESVSDSVAEAEGEGM